MNNCSALHSSRSQTEPYKYDILKTQTGFLLRLLLFPYNDYVPTFASILVFWTLYILGISTFPRSPHRLVFMVRCPTFSHCLFSPFPAWWKFYFLFPPTNFGIHVSLCISPFLMMVFRLTYIHYKVVSFYTNGSWRHSNLIHSHGVSMSFTFQPSCIYCTFWPVLATGFSSKHSYLPPLRYAAFHTAYSADNDDDSSTSDRFVFYTCTQELDRRIAKFSFGQGPKIIWA
jgi:hypothetical protein